MEYLRSPKICTSATPFKRFKRILDINVNVVADELVVVAVVEAVEAGARTKEVETLLTVTPVVLDFVGQTALHSRDAVLDIDRRDIEGTSQLEYDVDGRCCHHCRWWKSCSACLPRH